MAADVRETCDEQLVFEMTERKKCAEGALFSYKRFVLCDHFKNYVPEVFVYMALLLL